MHSWSRSVRFKTILVFALTLIALVAVACSSGDDDSNGDNPTPPPAAQPTSTPPSSVSSPTPAQPTAPPAQGQTGTLTVSVESVGSPIFLNRDGVFPDNMLPYLYGIQETLAGWANETCESPMLATSWEVAPDQSKVTFHLREDADFRSADRNWGVMTAEDVAWSLNDAGTDNPNSKHSAAGEVNQTFGPWVAVDDFTVEAPFKTYRGDFITFNTVSSCNDSVGIVSKKAFDELGENRTRTTPIGTGPFVVKNWLPKERIEAEARTEHWRIVPAYKNLILIETPEGSVRKAMLETGEADIAPVPIPDVPALQNKGFEFHEGLRQFQGNFIYFAGNYWADTVPETGDPVSRDVGFKPDDKHPWIGDPNDPARMESARMVRQAMAMAIDRDAIAQTILAGFGGAIYGGGTGQTFHQDDPEFKDKWVIPYDPAKAQELLAEAGYANGFDTELYCPVDIGVSREVCLAVAGMWQENLDISVSLDTAAYTSRRPTMVGREINVPWIAPWGPNRISAQQETGGTCGCRLFPETTGGYNPGIEAAKLWEFYQLTSKQDKASAENLASREEIADWDFEQMLSVGVVEVPTLIGFNPDTIESWDLQPLRLINGFESIKLKK